MIIFKDLPNMETPINSENLNANFEEASVAISQIEPITNEKVWFKNSENLVNVDLITQNYGLKSEDGSLYSATDRAVTDFIEVKELRNYIVSGCSIKAICFYNSEKLFISSLNEFYAFNTPSGCKYLRFAFDNTVDYSKIKLEDGTETKEIYVKNANGVFEEFINISDSLENYYANTNDSKFNDVTQIIGGKFQPNKLYVITNIPLSDGNYIQHGSRHTVLGCEIENRTYGYQLSLSYSFEGARFRIKDNGVWREWSNIGPIAIKTGVEIETDELIDEKKVYVKRVNCGNLPSNTSKTVETNLSNINIIDYEGIATSGGNAIKMEEHKSNEYAIVLGIENYDIKITTYVTSYTNYTGHVTIYYTKN